MKGKQINWITTTQLIMNAQYNIVFRVENHQTLFFGILRTQLYVVVSNNSYVPKEYCHNHVTPFLCAVQMILEVASWTWKKS